MKTIKIKIGNGQNAQGIIENNFTIEFANLIMLSNRMCRINNNKLEIYNIEDKMYNVGDDSLVIYRNVLLTSV
ncbi:hypothetical protein [Clostridium beijerinckii]|uniref:hypothetical protein n=1 Tax=Clostridium beijerinckii TaxID=1520 RepID=UPI00098BDE4C|nr:hypothetical protein [Clostridium beijerinckii]NRT78132.1 hypothetical protein [Clostridium beijerinckii]OOM44788.1 hypothetical protein CBEIJ_35340 [Clostridium beijerinckii]